MSLTAVPAYFLARRVLAPLPSLFAAVLAVVVPSMVYTGTLMTETLFYPLFVFVALALVLALERPTAVRQLALLGVCLVAYLTRTQAVVLVPAIATAPFALALADRQRLRAALRTFSVLYGVLAVAVVGAIVVEVATFASAISPRIEERNFFYVAPLFLTALLVWIERGLPRPGRVIAISAAIAAALPGVIPYRDLIDAPAESDTLALLPFWWLQEHLITMSEVVLVAVAAAIVLACAFLLVPARWAYALPVVVLVWFLFVTERIENFDHGFPKASIGARYQGIKLPHRDWIDRLVGRGANVAFVWANEDKNAQFRLWENEFFNRSVGHVYDLHGPSPGTLPETPLSQSA